MNHLRLEKPAFMLDGAGRGHKLIIEILIFLLVFIIGSNIISVIIFIPEMVHIFTNGEIITSAQDFLMRGDFVGYLQMILDVVSNLPVWLTWLNMFATIAMIGTVLVYCCKINKRSLSNLGLVKKGAAREYCVGFVLGAAFIGVSVLICCLTGSMRIASNTDVSFGWLAAFLLAFLVQGFSEELTCRGYLMPAIARRNKLWVGVLVSSVLFALGHILNSGLTLLAFFNLFLFALFAALYTIARGSLWGIAALHSAWNFFQGNIFGIEVSGINVSATAAKCTPVPGRELLNGGAFGLEGGLAVTAVLVLGIAVEILCLWKKQSQKKLPAES